MPRALMIQGTASHVGKSVLAAAFGRWLVDQGLRVAPFKAQNMSLNSYVTLAGEEIARSQATQAEALGLEPTADMNPILLKPMAQGSQVIVQGKPAGVMSIREYYDYKPRAWCAIRESFQRLAALHEAVVLEGAGSPAEINLTEHDLVNMPMAEQADAAVILVADIERGGVFAHLVGTWELLQPRDRDRIVGFVINKFRGDAGLLTSGLEYIQQRTGKPVLGVLPYHPAIQLDEEDSLAVDSPESHPLAPDEMGENKRGEIDIAVVRFPGLSNFTDFAALARGPGVSVRYVNSPGQLPGSDLIVLPGTRTTLGALAWLRSNGLAQALRQLAGDPQGPFIVGICGGCQLLGKEIADPERIESDVSQSEGLGLLGLDTRFAREKSLFRVEGKVIAPAGLCPGCPVIGYEVHQGHSIRGPGTMPWLRLQRHPGGAVVEDGAVSATGRVCGTYVHGLFDDARFGRALVAVLRRRRGLPELADQEWLSQREFWSRRYRRLGSWLADHCDLKPVVRALEL